MSQAQSTIKDIDLLADVRRLVVEVREMLVEMKHDQGDTRAGARTGPLILGDERHITLEEAVPLVWDKSAAGTKESQEAHVEILRMFATRGLGGVVLETTVRRKRWHTSREAVERFKSKAFGHHQRERPVKNDRSPRRRSLRKGLRTGV